MLIQPSCGRFKFLDSTLKVLTRKIMNSALSLYMRSFSPIGCDDLQHAISPVKRSRSSMGRHLFGSLSDDCRTLEEKTATCSVLWLKSNQVSKLLLKELTPTTPCKCFSNNKVCTPVFDLGGGGTHLDFVLLHL